MAKNNDKERIDACVRLAADLRSLLKSMDEGLTRKKFAEIDINLDRCFAESSSAEERITAYEASAAMLVKSVVQPQFLVDNLLRCENNALILYIFTVYLALEAKNERRFFFFKKYPKLNNEEKEKIIKRLMENDAPPARFYCAREILIFAGLISPGAQRELFDNYLLTLPGCEPTSDLFLAYEQWIGLDEQLKMRLRLEILKALYSVFASAPKINIKGGVIVEDRSGMSPPSDSNVPKS